MSARLHLPSPIQQLQPSSPDWPRALADLTDPPAALYVAGALPDLAHAVAIVGTRYASDEGLRFAERLARELTDAGTVVVSGGAAGIDAAAHRGALAAGGRTIAVLATGLIDAYPHQHVRLFEEIARSGALLCENDRKVGGAGWAFLRRNRLIAALAPTVVVVQAPVRSGALSTVRWARKMRRRVMVVPAAPWDEHGRGCVELLRKSAEICTSAADILSVSASGGERPSRALREPDKIRHDLNSLEAPVRRVWQNVRRAACHPDAIAAALDMPAAEVQEALLSLVLLGWCRQRADGCYVSSGG